MRFKKLVMAALVVPTPELANLHPQGDVWFGRRLPEYRLTLRGNNFSNPRDRQVHPIHLVGRYAICEIHDDSLAQPLSINQRSLGCHDLAREWNKAFSTLSYSVINETEPYVLSRPLRTQLRMMYLSVAATMVDHVANRRHLTMNDVVMADAGKAADLGSPAQPKLCRAWAKNPNFAQEAHRDGYFYSQWALLQQIGGGLDRGAPLREDCELGHNLSSPRPGSWAARLGEFVVEPDWWIKAVQPVGKDEVGEVTLNL